LLDLGSVGEFMQKSGVTPKHTAPEIELLPHDGYKRLSLKKCKEDGGERSQVGED
jgi:hypothetical protein